MKIWGGLCPPGPPPMGLSFAKVTVQLIKQVGPKYAKICFTAASDELIMIMVVSTNPSKVLSGL